MVRISPGLVARPPGMFSVTGKRPIAFIGSLSREAARIVANTSAPPVMSAFICSMFSDGFKEMPPLSNVTVLPTKTMGFCVREPPIYSRMMNWGGSMLPRETPSNPPMPSFSCCLRSKTLSRTLFSLAIFLASVTTREGVITLAGWLHKSRTKQVASPRIWPRLAPSLASFR